MFTSEGLWNKQFRKHCFKQCDQLRKLILILSESFSSQVLLLAVNLLMGLAEVKLEEKVHSFVCN